MKIIAIDAGASKSRVILNDTIKPNINKEITLDPCNYVIQGKNGIKELIELILTKFKVKSPERYYLIAGIAGATTSNSRNHILKLFLSYGFSEGKTKIYSDSELLLNSIGNDGIILIVGTGAICIGRKKLADGNYLEVKAGGYGYMFNSEPGGYSLGINAIQRCLAIEDGILNIKSNMPEKIKDHFSLRSIRELIPLIYKSRKVQKEISFLTPLIFESANNKDSVSLNLLRDHVNTLSSFIKTVYDKLDCEKANVYLHGGLFKNSLSTKLLIDPIINHKSLAKFRLKFKTLGIKETDTDPLAEAIRIIILKNLTK